MKRSGIRLVDFSVAVLESVCKIGNKHGYSRLTRELELPVKFVTVNDMINSPLSVKMLNDDNVTVTHQVLWPGSLVKCIHSTTKTK